MAAHGQSHLHDNGPEQDQEQIHGQWRTLPSRHNGESLRRPGRRGEAISRGWCEPAPFPEIEPGSTFNANFCRNSMYPDVRSAATRSHDDMMRTAMAARMFLCGFRYL